MGAKKSGDRARLQRELDRLQALGVTSVRVMAALEGFDHAPPAPPLSREELAQIAAARLSCANWCNERDGHCDFEHVADQCVCAGCAFCARVVEEMGEKRLNHACPSTGAHTGELHWGEGSAHIVPTMQPSAGVYEPELLEGLDFALHEIGARGMTAVLTLGNMWQWSGGFAAYVWWATGERPPKMTAREQVRGR